MPAPLYQANLQMNPLAMANRKPHKWNEMDLVARVGEIVRAFNDVVLKDRPAQQIEYVAAYPDYVFNLTGEESKIDRPSRIICYDIVKKESGSIGKEQFSRKQKHRPYPMEARTPVMINGRQKVLEVYMKPYDIQLRFDCLAPSDYESMVLIHDFEKLLEAHSPWLETGCQRFIYDGRTPSFFNRDTKYKSRTCLFFAQIQEIWTEEQDRIREIGIRFNGETEASSYLIPQE